MEYTVITGACGGLGGAFVEELARQGAPLLLLGRNAERLQRLAKTVKERYGMDVLTYEIDLTDFSQRLRFDAYLAERSIEVSRLINVAGADIQKGVCEYTQEKIAFQARLNFEAAVALCHIALSQKAKTLEIINISSVSGIYPMPYFAIYSATKRALWSFSVAFREEVKGKGVKVTAILPGAIPTREDVKRQIEGQGLWGKLAAKTPLSVAKASLKAVRKNKRKVIVGFWNKVMRVSTCWLPTAWRLKFIANRWSKISKDAF